MTRKITSHIVNAANDRIEISVLDEPGQGGACHDYKVRVDRGGGIGANYPILFQNGPINEVGVNGLTHEALLAILIDRMKGFQSGPYACRENALALTKLEEATHWLHSRTRQRMDRGVEGTHDV